MSVDNVVFSIMTRETGKIYCAFRELDLSSIDRFLPVFLKTPEYFILAGIGINADIGERDAIESYLEEFRDEKRRILGEIVKKLNEKHCEYAIFQNAEAEKIRVLELPEFEEIKNIDLIAYKKYLQSIDDRWPSPERQILAGIMCGDQVDPEFAAGFSFLEIYRFNKKEWPLFDDRMRIAKEAAVIVNALSLALEDARYYEPDDDTPRPGR